MVSRLADEPMWPPAKWRNRSRRRPAMSLVVARLRQWQTFQIASFVRDHAIDWIDARAISSPLRARRHGAAVGPRVVIRAARERATRPAVGHLEPDMRSREEVHQAFCEIGVAVAVAEGSGFRTLCTRFGKRARSECLCSLTSSAEGALACIVAATSSCPGGGFAAVQSTPRNVVSPFTVWVRPCLSSTSR
ncbi:MAG: hypothetical protein CAPSK01_000825 [Candidatus Accumulibacter vicinus]|uniref:Uncharacterized protein n=1 Tax=Candidatus Accumulibacter vicinus TaxID=2954382 RepID=A0A084Y4B8_9PROT|nr:MAG: hypothetical protein CAPSK01_000825 [Candidatus Accumulibacter vicinus]